MANGTSCVHGHIADDEVCNGSATRSDSADLSDRLHLLVLGDGRGGVLGMARVQRLRSKGDGADRRQLNDKSTQAQNKEAELEDLKEKVGFGRNDNRGRREEGGR